METSLQKIIAAIVGVMILFIIPVYIAFEKADDVSYSLALKLTQNFVDNVRDKGYISPEMYSDFVSGLYATNNTYDVQIEHVKKRYDPAIYIYDKKDDGNKGKLLHILDYNKYLTDEGELPTTITINTGIYNSSNSNVSIVNPSITMADGNQVNFTNGGSNVLTAEELYKLKIDEYKTENRIILDKGEIYADIRKLTGSRFDKSIYNPAYITTNEGRILISNKQGTEPDGIDYNTYIPKYDAALANNSKYVEGPVYNSTNSKIIYQPAAMYIEGMNLTAREAEDFYYTWRTLYNNAAAGDGRLVYDSGKIFADRAKVISVGNTIDSQLDIISDISVNKGSININPDKQIEGFETKLDYDKYISQYDLKQDLIAFEGEIYNDENSNIVNTRAAMWAGNKEYSEMTDEEKNEAEKLYNDKINSSEYVNDKVVVLNKGRIFAESESAVGYNSLTDQIREINIKGSVLRKSNPNALYIDGTNKLDFSKYIEEYRTKDKILYDEGGIFDQTQPNVDIVHTEGLMFISSNGMHIPVDYDKYIDEVLDNSNSNITIEKNVEFNSDDIYIENASVIVNGIYTKTLNNISEIKIIKDTGRVTIDGIEYDSTKSENPDDIVISLPTFIALQNKLASDVQILNENEINGYINEYLANNKITYTYSATYLKNKFFYTHESVDIYSNGKTYSFLKYLNKEAYDAIFNESVINDINNENAVINVPPTIFNSDDLEVKYEQLQISGENSIDINSDTMKYVDQYYENRRIIFEESNIVDDNDINIIHPKIEIFEKDTSLSTPIYSFRKNIESENSSYTKYLNEYKGKKQITIQPARIYGYDDVTVTRSEIVINPETSKENTQKFTDENLNYEKYLNEFERTGKITLVPATTYNIANQVEVIDAHVSIKPNGYTSPMIDIYENDNKELYDMYKSEYLNSNKVTLKYKVDDLNVYRANITIDKLKEENDIYSIDRTQVIYDNTDLNGDGTFEYLSYKAEYNLKGLITFADAVQISAADLKVTEPSVTITDPNTGEVIVRYEADYSELTDDQRYQIYNLRVDEWNNYSQLVNKKVTYIADQNCVIEKAHVINEEIITDKQIVSKIFYDTGISKVQFLRECLLGNGDMYKSLSYVNENSYVMNEGDQINVTVKNKNQTIASVFYSLFTANVNNEEIPKIYVNYGGTVKNSGDTIINEINGTVTSQTGRIFKYREQAQEITLSPGRYQIEAWGASGGGYEETNTSTTGGKGAYVKGVFNISKETTLYIYVGGQGTKYSESNEQNGGYNGGGNSYNGFGGGGSSDVRLIKGDSSDTASLLTRILVAAGGGGSSKARGNLYGNGGNAGDLYNSQNGTSVGANQNFVGKGALSSKISIGYDNYTKPDGTTSNIPVDEKGDLGKGGSVDFDGAGAGGSGYFGGSASHDEYAGGGGGLSFVYKNEQNVIGGIRLPLKMLFESKYETKIIDDIKMYVDSDGRWDGISYESSEVRNGQSEMLNPLQHSAIPTIGNKGNGLVIIKKLN